VYVEQWSDYIDDFIEFLRVVYSHTKQFNCEHFVLGHSMGGLIAAGVGHRLQGMGCIAMGGGEQKQSQATEPDLPLVAGIITSAPLMKPYPVPGGQSLQPVFTFLNRFIPKITLSFIKPKTDKVSQIPANVALVRKNMWMRVNVCVRVRERELSYTLRYKP
jgi:alpha-beta hydrolase superfamily lysophospholipase